MVSLPLYLLSWGTWNLGTRDVTWCEWWRVLHYGWFHDQHLGQSHGMAHWQGVYTDQFTQYLSLEIKFPYFSKLIHLYPCVLLSMRLMCFWGKALVHVWENNVLFSQRKPQLSRQMQISPRLLQTASGGALIKTEGEKRNNNKKIMAYSATLWPGHTAWNTAFSPRVEMQFREYH